jgi:hypothetical protein
MKVGNGKIADHWGVGNLLKMMVQLGAVTLNIEGIEGRHD